MIRVFCIDDNADILDMLRFVINDTADMVCVGGFESTSAMRGELAKAKPDVLLLDYNIPGEDSMSALRALKIRHPEVACIVLSGYDDIDTIERAHRSGAARCLCKDADSREILAAIRDVCIHA